MRVRFDDGGWTLNGEKECIESSGEDDISLLDKNKNKNKKEEDEENDDEEEEDLEGLRPRGRPGASTHTHTHPHTPTQTQTHTPLTSTGGPPGVRSVPSQTELCVPLPMTRVRLSCWRAMHRPSNPRFSAPSGTSCGHGSVRA